MDTLEALREAARTIAELDTKIRRVIDQRDEAWQRELLLSRRQLAVAISTASSAIAACERDVRIDKHRIGQARERFSEFRALVAAHQANRPVSSIEETADSEKMKGRAQQALREFLDKVERL